MISIIVPSYNEEGNIENTVKKLKDLELKEDKEIVIVDDGSQDKTAEKARKSNADKVVTYKQNRGKGYAMKKGVEEAEGEIILFTDADQHHIEKIPRFTEKLKEKDIVIGKRDFDKIPWPRRINIALTKLSLLMATGRTVKDPICGIRAMKKKTFQEMNLEQDRFEIESEINFKALKKNMEIGYVPIEIDYPEETFEFNELDWVNSFHLATYLVKSVLKSWLGKY